MRNDIHSSSEKKNKKNSGRQQRVDGGQGEGKRDGQRAGERKRERENEASSQVWNNDTQDAHAWLRLLRVIARNCREQHSGENEVNVIECNAQPLYFYL